MSRSSRGAAPGTRPQKSGYDVVLARTTPDGKAKIEPFMTGLLDQKANEFFGRPVYLLQMKDGSLLVSDEQNGAIYRISYDAKTAASPAPKKK